ncbi:MAG: ECF transporter S component [Promethearchaeota archaeon]
MSSINHIKMKNSEELLSDENDSLIETGNTSAFRKNYSRYFFTTLELLLSAIVGVMGGIISSLIPFSVLIKTWYPFVGGTQLVSGYHILSLVLIYGLLKKKRTIFLTAFIQGFVNFLFGASWGISEVFIMLYEGFFFFLGIILIELTPEKDTYLGWGLAAGLGNISQVPLFWLLTGKIYLIHWTLFVMACLFSFISGMLMAGVLGKTVVDQIKKTGIL